MAKRWAFVWEGIVFSFGFLIRRAEDMGLPTHNCLQLGERPRPSPGETLMGLGPKPKQGFEVST